MRRDDFEYGVSSAERIELESLAERLLAERPLPRPEFRGDLRRRIATTERSRRGLRLRVVTYVTAGAALLLVAALGVNDVGPLAPQPPPEAIALVSLTNR